MKKLLSIVLFISSPLLALELKKPFTDSLYVYQDGGSRVNNFCPSNWMGSYGDLKYNGMFKEKPGQGISSIQIKYDAKRAQGDGWAGIYWASICNSWGERSGSYNLTGLKKITFMARGEKGGEVIDKFFMGGICGEKECDTASGQTDTIELTKKWQSYEIDLTNESLASVVGGFGFTITADSNPDGAVFYIDEVKYVK